MMKAGVERSSPIPRARQWLRGSPPAFLPSLVFLPSLLVLLLATGTPGGAQQASADGTLRGQVVDALGEAGIGGAEVEFLDDSRRVRAATVTDENGDFVLLRLPPGAFQLRVKRLGYTTTVTPFWWIRSGEVVSVIVRVQPDAILLAPLEVTGISRVHVPVLDGFYRRMQASVGGFFLSREQIEGRNPARITDLLVDVPGIRLEQAPGRSGQLMVVSFARSLLGRGGGDCPVQVFVDGILASRGQGSVPLDELASPNALEGMEVYQGLGTLPAEFMTPNARCGVIALWTRRGK